MMKAVPQFCSGAIDAGGLEKYFADMITAKFEAMDMQLGCKASTLAWGCSCNVTCLIINKDYDIPLLSRLGHAVQS
jgi:hypothetical protein